MSGQPDTAKLFTELMTPWKDVGDSVPDNSDPSESSAEDPAGDQPEVTIPPLTFDSFERAASQLSTDVTLAALRHHRGKHLLFHAGGIARPDGAVVAIVGPSGRGKTTTIRNLAQHYGYVSDETIAITMQNEVLPYRKPLSVITEGHRDKLQIAPSELGLQPLPDAELRIAGLALLERRDDGAEESRVEAAPLAEALVELVQQTSYLAELPNPLRRIAEIADETGGVRRLLAGAPERIVEVAEELFVAGECEPWRQVLPGSSAADLPFAPAQDVVDAIECVDGTVVFTKDRQVRLLQGAGPLVWRGLCEGDDWAALEARAVSMLGTPPHGTLREALVATLGDLVTAGVAEKR